MPYTEFVEFESENVPLRLPREQEPLPRLLTEYVNATSESRGSAYSESTAMRLTEKEQGTVTLACTVFEEVLCACETVDSTVKHRRNDRIWLHTVDDLLSFHPTLCTAINLNVYYISRIKALTTLTAQG